MENSSGSFQFLINMEDISPPIPNIEALRAYICSNNIPTSWPPSGSFQFCNNECEYSEYTNRNLTLFNNKYLPRVYTCPSCFFGCASTIKFPWLAVTSPMVLKVQTNNSLDIYVPWFWTSACMIRGPTTLFYPLSTYTSPHTPLPKLAVTPPYNSSMAPTRIANVS